MQYQNVVRIVTLRGKGRKSNTKRKHSEKTSEDVSTVEMIARKRNADGDHRTVKTSVFGRCMSVHNRSKRSLGVSKDVQMCILEIEVNICFSLSFLNSVEKRRSGEETPMLQFGAGVLIRFLFSAVISKSPSFGVNGSSLLRMVFWQMIGVDSVNWTKCGCIWSTLLPNRQCRGE